MTVQKSKKTNKHNKYFHIYNIGIENRKLFSDEEDYNTFLGYLKDYLTSPPDPQNIKKSFSVKGRTFRGVPHLPKNYFNKVELIAYSLIPDHFHLLVNQLINGSLEKLVRSLCTRYAIYYNKKYNRHGSLFSGPYKSIEIKDNNELLQLTRYFHRESLKHALNEDVSQQGKSSYKEYLGIRKTSWIKTEVIFSYLDATKSDYFKGMNGYKSFVEKYEPKQEEQKTLERIIIESISNYQKVSHNIDGQQPLEKRDLDSENAESFKANDFDSVFTPKPKIFQFVAATTALFILLLFLGIRNVKISAAQIEKPAISSPPSPAPQVAGSEDTKTEQQKKTKLVVIKITDGSEGVNIRKGPTTKSEKVGKAEVGETFEFVSEEEDSEWYQIKFNNEPAYVSASYAEIKEGDHVRD